MRLEQPIILKMLLDMEANYITAKLYSCRTSSLHPDYDDVFASATVTFKLCESGQSFCCVDGDGLFAQSETCPEGTDPDDSVPLINIPVEDFPRDGCSNK